MAWRRTVIELLRAALRVWLLQTDTTLYEMETLLAKQEARWWSIKIQSFKSREHFLRYAGRYVRRPPIAQHRITFIGERSVRFWRKDKKQRRRVYVRARWKSSLIAGLNTFPNAISTRFAALGCSRHAP